MKEEFITIKIGTKRYRKIPIDDIIYCKAEGSYSIIKTRDVEYTLCELLKNTEKYFIENRSFLRVNRSYLININMCIEIKTGKKPELLLNNGEVIFPKKECMNTIINLFNVENT